MSEGQIICRGWLRKSPPEHKIGRASWKKRWFVLREGRLTGDPNLLEYYKRDNAKKPIAAINLDQCEQVDAGLTFEKKEFVNAYIFDIVTPKRTYFLVTDSEAEMNHWVGCICQVCGFNCTNDENGVPLCHHVEHPGIIRVVTMGLANLVWEDLMDCQLMDNAGNLSSSQSSVEAPPPRPPKPITSSPSISRGSPASVHSGSSSSARGSPRQASRASPQTGSPMSKLSHQNGSAGSPRPKPNPRNLKQPAAMPVDNGEQYFPLAECITGEAENSDIRSPAKQSPRTARTESRKRDSFPDMPPPLPPTEYDVLPHSKAAKAMSNGGVDNPDVYSVVPPPRPVTTVSLSSNPEENYDLVPPPRLARQASSVSTDAGETYDMVPPRRLTNQMSVGSQQGDIYDVVPPPKVSSQLSNQSSWSSQQDMYDTVPHRKLATQLSTHSITGEEYNVPLSANVGMGVMDFAQDYQVPTATKNMRMNSVKQQPIPIRNRSGSGLQNSFEDDDVVDNEDWDRLSDSLSENFLKSMLPDDETYNIPPTTGTGIRHRNSMDETYDIPPRRNSSSFSESGNSKRTLQRRESQENYDIPPSRVSSKSHPSLHRLTSRDDTYDTPPPREVLGRRQSQPSSAQEIYQVPINMGEGEPSSASSRPLNGTYPSLSANDLIPPPRPPKNKSITDLTGSPNVPPTPPPSFEDTYSVPPSLSKKSLESVSLSDPIPPPGLDDFYDFPKKLKGPTEAEDPPPPVPRTAKQHHYINAATSEVTQDENYIAMAVTKASETSPDNVYTSMASGPKGMAEGYTDDLYMFMGGVEGIPSPPPLLEVTPGPAPAATATSEKKPPDLPPPIRRDLKPGSKRADGRPGKANIPPPLDLSGTSNFTEEDTYGVFPIKSPITKSFSQHGSNGYKPPQPKDSADTEDTDSSDSEDYDFHKAGSGSALLPQIYHPMEGIGKAAQEAAKAKKKDKVEYLDLEMSSSPDMEKAKKPSPRSSPLPQRTSSTVYTRLDIDRTMALSKTKEARQESYRTSEGS
ncbi:GPI-anchor transamidase subunit gab1 [Branchiostoma belcheri]|nr:GPI-anchor transamidase subunit gab1 [Branchiostoma belcheri]